MVPKSILLNAKEKPLPPNRLECSVCKQRFWMTSKYLDHMSSHKHLLLSCNICNKGFYSQKLLDGHYVTHDEVINTYDCEKCSRKFLQKYQLEQHMQFHFLSFAYQPEEPQKKKVRFNNILESKDISDDDFSNDSVEDSNVSDEDDNDSFEDDSDSFEEKNDVNKITITRSGRIVKAKKIFENEEPEVKRRYRKLQETGEKVSVGSKNVSSVKLSSTVCDADQLSERILTKKLYVLTEKIPDQLYKSYLEKGNVCTESSRNNSLNSIKSDLEKIKLPQQSTSKVDNTANSQKTLLTFPKKIKFPQQSTSKIDQTANFQKNISPTFPNSFKTTNLSNLSNEHHKKYQALGSVTYIVKTPSLLPNQEKNSTNSKLDVSIKPTISSPEKTYTSPIKPQIDKQFLYVGPKQDLEKIKTIIEEMKTIQDIEPATVHITSNNMQPVVGEKILTSNASLNFKNPNQNFAKSTAFDNSVSKKFASLDACPEIANITNLPLYNNNLIAKDGILGKKIVKDFLVVKVTPELMQEMHQKSLESQLRYNIEEPMSFKETTLNLNSTDILQSSKERTKMKCQSMLQISSLNKDSKVSEIKNDKVSKDADVFKTNVAVSKQSEISFLDTSTSISDSYTSEIYKDASVKPINQDPKKDDNLYAKNEPSAPHNSDEPVKLSNRVMELYKAKFAEKERKKKEKYELKKRMRHVEKLLNKEQNSENISSMCNSDKTTIVCPDDIIDKVKKQSKSLDENKNGVIHIEDKISSQLLDQKTSKGQNKRNSDNARIINSDDTIEKDKKQPKILKQNKIGVQKEGKVISQLPDEKTSKYRNKSEKCATEDSTKLNTDPYSNLSLVIGETFTIRCSCNFEECKSDGSLHDVNGVHCIKWKTDSESSSNSVFKNSSSSTENTEKEAVKRAYEISLKFEKSPSEAKCLAYLDELNSLFTSFNIGKKCPFIFKILRYCRLHVESYDVKERAVALHAKITKLLKSSSFK